jgi:hypothetical protein
MSIAPLPSISERRRVASPAVTPQALAWPTVFYGWVRVIYGVFGIEPKPDVAFAH